MSATESELHFVGDNSGWAYQVVSAPVAVPRNHPLLLRLRVKVEAGRVALGILSGDQAYFLKNTHWKITSDEEEEYLFNSADNSKLFLVIVNDNVTGAPHVVTRLTIYHGSYSDAIEI